MDQLTSFIHAQQTYFKRLSQIIVQKLKELMSEFINPMVAFIFFQILVTIRLFLTNNGIDTAEASAFVLIY